ncbi:MAG: VanZ family protein [Patescibacteria group bacterium]
MKKKLSFLIFYWGPPILLALLIFKLSSGAVPSASSVYWQDFAFKKSAHMLFFGVLAVLLYRALIKSGMSKKKAVVWAILASTFYGMTDEYHQSFSQAREARVRDVGFDGIGSVLSVLFIYYIVPKLPPSILEIAKRLEIS